MSRRESKMEGRRRTAAEAPGGKPGAQILFWRRRGDREGAARVGESNPGMELAQEIERLNQLRLQHIHMLTGAESSCVLLRRDRRVEPLFWLDTSTEQRRALVEAVSAGRPPEGWETISEREADLEVVLCLKSAAREGLKAMKSYLIHWFAAQKFPCR